MKAGCSSGKYPHHSEEGAGGVKYIMQDGIFS